jgi:hypothetical protein
MKWIEKESNGGMYVLKKTEDQVRKGFARYNE